MTRFEYRLHPVTRLFGGAIYYPASHTRETLSLVRDVQAGAPDELVCIIFLGNHGAFGAPVVVVAVAFNGPLDAGTEAARPLREALPVLGDRLGPISYLDLQAINAPIPFGVRAYWKGHFVRLPNDEAIELKADAFLRHEGASGGILIEFLPGAARRIPAESAVAAFGQRAAVANLSAVAGWLDPADDDRQIAWVRGYTDSLAPHSLSGAGYLNYGTPDEPADRVRAAFGPDAYARLAAVKRRCDPENRFRFNMNIPPA